MSWDKHGTSGLLPFRLFPGALFATSAPGLQGHLPASAVSSCWLAPTHSSREKLSQQLCVEDKTPPRSPTQTPSTEQQGELAPAPMSAGMCTAPHQHPKSQGTTLPSSG